MSREATVQTQQTTTSHPLSQGSILQRKCSSCGQHKTGGGTCANCQSKNGAKPLQKLPTIQTKLTVGRPNDKYEQEADRVAEQIMRMPTSNTAAVLGTQFQLPTIQRRCTNCEEEKKIQTKAVSDPMPDVTPAVASRIQSLQGGGQKLSTSVRNFFEPRFGQDFSNVRVHTDPNSTRDLSARAYTFGSDIVFGTGQYAPETSAGKKLLGHELTHVVQQMSGPLRSVQRIQRQCVGEEPESDEGWSLSHYHAVTRDYIEDSSDPNARRAVYTDEPGAIDWMGRFRAANPDREFICYRAGARSWQVWSRASGSSTPRPQRCGRDDKRVSGFPNPHINQITINLGNLSSGLSITWSRSTAETSALPSSFQISPGAGLCTTCCNVFRDSRRDGSLCTPQGNDFKVDWISPRRPHCQLGNTAWAHNATYFAANIRSGIAIHKGPLPSYPASHGCVRTTDEGSAIIHDNSIDQASVGDDTSVMAGQTATAVSVSGDWNSSRCYDNIRQRSARRRRSGEQCRSSAQVESQQTETLLAGAESPIFLEEPVDGAGPV